MGGGWEDSVKGADVGMHGVTFGHVLEDDLERERQTDRGRGTSVSTSSGLWR